MKTYNLLDKMSYLNEVAVLEYDEWATNKENNRKNRINQKIKLIKDYLNGKDFCKLILLDGNILVGFISIFPEDSDECKDLTPWYATIYIKKEYRGRGYSKILNDAILDEAKKRKYPIIYLKTNLDNYYEKFGAKFIRNLSSGEKLYKFDLIKN